VNLTSRRHRRLSTVLAAAWCCGLAAVAFFHADRKVIASSAKSPVHANVPAAKAKAPKPDASASQAAFLRIYKVLTSPRCQNCHPSGDAPLQGDDSHVHIQNVKRGTDGHGVTAMRCDACHQDHNLPGAHLPPGNPKWALPPPEHKMVFVGRAPGELCRQLKDTKQNGGRSLEQLFDHVAHDDLVGWGWSPGNGRALPPLSREETANAMRTWIDDGAACPE
jgi:hypothetical protein